MNVYAMVKCEAGGYSFVKTHLADGCDLVTTRELVRLKKKDNSLHFVSFAFVDEFMMVKIFEGYDVVQDGASHLLPIGVWGSMKEDKYYWMILDGNDFKKFEYEMTRGDAFGTRYLCMDGLAFMSGDRSRWFTDIEIVGKKKSDKTEERG